MATAAAAIAARARREVLQLFFDKEAYSPDRAIEFEPRMGVQQRYLGQLIDQGIVREVSLGRYWFDLPLYREREHEQFVWSMRILAVGAAIAIVLFAVQWVMR